MAPPQAPVARRLRSRIALAATMFGFLCGPAPARADLLDDVLGILHTAGVIDSAVVEAKPLIQCMVDGKSVEYCAESVAKAKGITITPGDPKIKKVLDIFKAVKSKDWIQVFHLSSEQVVCGLVPGGAVKDIFCGEVFKVAKPVIGKVYNAVTQGDWWELVALLGPAVACEVIPGGEVKDAICGALGKALVEVGKFAVGGVNAGKDALIDVGEKISGQEQHMPTAKYYELYWYPERHADLLIILKGGKASHKVKYDHCVGYFDSHKASKAHAEQWCGKMESQLAGTVKALVDAANAAPDAYFEARVKPRLFELALDTYYQSKPLKGTEPYLGLSQTAGYELSKVLPPLGAQTIKYTVPPYTAFGWMVDRVMEKTFQAVALQKAFAVGPALASFAAAGCPKEKQQGGSTRIQVRCDSYDGLAECKAKLDHATSQKDSHTHCLVDQGAATKKLSFKIAQELGSKRCKADGSNILCTRPYKKEKCEELLAVYKKQFYLYNYCSLKEDQSFIDGKKLSKQILDTLNGVKKAGGTVGPGGRVNELILVPPVHPCKTTWDPLAIACQGLLQGEINTSLAVLGTQLGHCPPDPNKDGADAPCYSGPYSIKDQAAGLVQGTSVVPGGVGEGTGGSGASVSQTSPAGFGGLPPPVAKVQEGGSQASGKKEVSMSGALAGTGGIAQPKPGSAANIPAGSASGAARTTVGGGGIPVLQPLPGAGRSGGRTGGGAPPTGARTLPSVARITAADIRSGPRVTVAGRYPAVWGQAVAISDADARRAVNGVCEVAIQHEALNSGTAASGPFARRWINRQNPAPRTDAYPPIPAGGSASRTDTLPLKPGVNQLTLTLDPLNQVQEGNEANNLSLLVVHVNGNCGLSASAPGGETAPTAPGTRLPAVQQPPVSPPPADRRLRLPGR